MTDLDLKRANTAATAPAPAPAPDSASDADIQGPKRSKGPKGPKGPGHFPAARVAAAIVAVLAIGFCAWSMGEYVQGRDPLAFLGHPTAQDESSSSESTVTEDDSSNTPASLTELTAGTIKNEITDSLTFDGKDVSLPAKDFRVVLGDEGIWVEQVSGEGAAKLVDLSTKRAAALSTWAGNQAKRLGVKLPQVTWLCEDKDGVLCFTVSFATDSVPRSGDTAALLAKARGYQIAPGTYAGLKNPSFEASGGTAPVLPDGTAAKAGSIVEWDASSSASEASAASGDMSSDSKGVVRLVSLQDSSGEKATSSGGSAGAAGGSGRSSSSSRSSGSSSKSQMISVSVSVRGSKATVSLPAGSTALDALLATGASVEMGTNPAGRGGSWVYAINGLGQDASHGWTYAVNGGYPNVMSDQYVLKNGDSVSWNYVSS